jgi:hypothetical protein
MSRSKYVAMLVVAVLAAVSLARSQADEPKKPTRPEPAGKSVWGRVTALSADANSKLLYVKLYPSANQEEPVRDWLAIDAEKGPQLVTVIEQAIAQKASDVEIHYDAEYRVTAVSVVNLGGR